MIKVGTIALASLYLAVYIAAFIGAILPWIAIPIENLFTGHSCKSLAPFCFSQSA